MLSIFNSVNRLFNTTSSPIPALLPLRSKPAEPGDTFSDFYLKADQGYWEGKPTFISSNNLITEKQLFKKPLVLAFYSPEWKDYGLQQLKTLNFLQQEINLLGGQLLVIADTDLRTLRGLIIDHELKLNIYSDPGYAIAENLGVYNAADPIYNRISGINNNAPLLATYVITTARKISFKYIDGLADSFPAEELLGAVFSSRKSI